MGQLQVSTLRVEGIDDLCRALDGADTRSVPLGSATAQGTIVRATGDDIVLTAGQWSAEIRTRGAIGTDRVSLGVKLDSESTHFSFRSGREVLPGDVYTLARGDDVDHRVSGPIRYAFVSLDAGRLLKQIGEDALRADVEFWERRHWFCAAPSIRMQITRSIQRLVGEALRPGRAVTGPALRLLMSELIEPFLWGYIFDERACEERSAVSSATIVKRVENWVDGQSPETIQIGELCAALRLSRRTLQRAFNETLGMGPARYLTLKRLAAARAELRDAASTGVTDTAIKYGFWELGRFAKDYREVFGERPSETLRRRAK